MSIDLTEAIEAGLSAIEPADWTISNRQRMEAVLTAALPHIEAQLREQIEGELRTAAQHARDAHLAANSDHFAHDYCRWVGHAEALTSAAARIARTPKETDHA